MKKITGSAFRLDVELGLSSPTFQAIVRNLIVLLSNSAVRQFAPRRNGLGLNDILYIAILVEHFRKRTAAGKSAGELILIGEPEAHFHPKFQATLVAALRELPFQVIATTHSTQVTSKVPLSSFVMLTQRPAAATAVTAPLGSPALTVADRHDLERYLVTIVDYAFDAVPATMLGRVMGKRLLRQAGEIIGRLAEEAVGFVKGSAPQRSSSASSSRAQRSAMLFLSNDLARGARCPTSRSSGSVCSGSSLHRSAGGT